MARFWPKVTNSAEAGEAATSGAYFSFFVAFVTALVSIISIFVDHPVLGVDGWALFDAVAFAFIGWRILKFSLPWALVGILLLIIEDTVKLSNGQSPGLLGLVIFLGFLGGLRGTWFLYRNKPVAGPPPPMPVTSVSPAPPTLAEPSWLDELPGWAEVRLADQNLASVAPAEYRKQLFASVWRLRITMLSESEFAKTCKVTAQALLLRTYVMIVGSERQARPDEILVAMLAIFPDYVSYYKYEDVVSDVISLRDFGKLQMFEAEMFPS